MWLSRLLLLVAVGCVPEPDPPVLTGVSPGWGWNGERTEVVVEGENFFPTVAVGRADAIDGEFTLSLRADPAVPIEGVTRISFEALSGVIPEGVAPGFYSLGLLTPAGFQATLVDAFEVRATRADRIELSVTEAGYDVGEYARIGVRVLDPNGGLVEELVPVELRATSELGAAGVRFLDDGLVEQVPLEGEVGIGGWVDGAAEVYVTSSVEDNVRFGATAPTLGESVGEGSVLLSWEPGAISRLEVELLDDDAVVTAGEVALVDVRAYDGAGAPIAEDVRVEVALSLPAECGTPSPALLRLDKAGPYEVVFPTACAEAYLYVTTLGLDPAVSAPFAIVPGPVVGYEVVATPTLIEAGGVVNVSVSAVDAWGNVVPSYTRADEPSLTDNVGGVDSAGAAGSVECNSFYLGVADCSTNPEVAAAQVILTAVGLDGFTGTSAPITVEPGPATAVALSVTESALYAGQSFGLSGEVQDVYGNPREVDLSATPVLLGDDTGTLDCAWVGPAVDYSCILTLTTPATTLTMQVGLVAGETTTPVSVTNGELAVVEVSGPSGEVTAGESFQVGLLGSDRWANAYLVPVSGPEVDVSDSTGTLATSRVQLDATGAATFATDITRSAEGVQLFAAQGGVQLGVSAPFVVVAGPAAQLEVSTPAWTDLADPAEIEVTARDTYGNVAPDYAGIVTLTPSAGLCDGLTLSAFDGGVASEPLPCSRAGLEEAYQAGDAEGLTGSGATFDVVDFACATPPTAALALDGGDNVVVCIVSGVATAAVSLAGSTGDVHHVSDGEAFVLRTVAEAHTASWVQPGVRRVTLVTVTTEGCGAYDEGLAYVAEADGSVAGPVTLTTADASIRSGDTTSVTATALTCSGDVAAGAPLRVWADLGAPDAQETGEGLELTLDGAGEATFDWASTSQHAGTATLYAGAPAGGAYGEASLEITQDGVHPMVVSSSPSGTWVEEVAEVSIVLDEEMSAASVHDGTVALGGPVGTISATVSLGDDLRTISIVPDDLVDAAAGTWTPVLFEVRDLAGNVLSGDWSGVTAIWSGTFGAVADLLPTLGACLIDQESFTPDGDPGAGEEADEVAFTPSTSSAPAWWRLELRGEDDGLVRTAWEPGSTATLYWDGRGDHGRIEAEGLYTWAVYAVDANGNEALAGEGTVALRHGIALP